MLVRGAIRVHIHLVTPITMRTPLSLRDIVSHSDTELGDGSTVTFCLPPDTATLIHIRRYWFVTGGNTAFDRTGSKFCSYHSLCN